MHSVRSRGRTACAAAALAVAVAASAQAQLVFDAANSSVTFRHTEDSASPSLRRNTRAFQFNDPLLANAFDFDNLFSLGTSNSTAKAGVDAITNSTTGSFRLPSGTGIAQVNPAPRRYLSFSELQIFLDLRWNVGSLGTSTSLVPYSSYGVAGIVGAGGGSASLIQAITVQNLSAGNSVLRTADLNANISFTTAGAFSEIVTRSMAFTGGSGPLAAGTKLAVSGTIKFRAKNDESPSNIGLLDGELGGQSNLYTGAFGATGSWQDPLNWVPSPDLPAGTFPSGDVRARLVSTDLNADSRTITLNAPVDIAELEIDDLDTNTINAATPGDYLGTRILRIGDSNGNGPVIVNANLAAASGIPGSPDRHVNVESSGGLTLNGNILSSPGATVTFSGRGPVTINSNNSASLSNPLVVSSGVLTATTPGALGSGTVTVRGGKLVLAAANATASTAPIRVEQNGQLTFPAGGPIPQPSNQFDVAAFSAIEGSNAQRNALLVNNGTNGGNLTLAADAMIVRRALTPVIPNPTSDVRGLGTTPQYIYGISADVPAGASLAFDSNNPGPYCGFGVPRAQVVFGAPNPTGGPSTTLETLQLNGNTKLVALPGGRLICNSRLFFSAGTITVAGGGEIVLNNQTNNFLGTIRVAYGALALNGNLGNTGTLGTRVVLDGPTAELRGGGQSFQGFVDRVDVVSGTIAPGDVAPGSLRINELALLGGPVNSGIRFTLDRPETSDFLRVFGSFTGSGRVDIEPRPGFGAGMYTLFRFDQPNPSATLQIGSVPPDFQSSFEVVPGGVGAPAVGLLIVSPVGVAVGVWNVPAGGDFGNPANWNGPVPDGVSSVANFGSVITAPTTVNLVSPRTLGTINFFSRQNSYNIAGPGTITFDGVLDEVGINIAHGGHTISAPVVFNVSPRITGTILGAGITLTQDMQAAPGLTLTSRNAVAQVKNLRIDAVDIAGGIVRVLPAAGPNNPGSTGRVKSLLIASDVPPLEPTQSAIVSALDLNNSAIVIDYDNASPIDTIRTYLQRGYGNGSWDGSLNGAITSNSLALLYQGGSPSYRPTLGLFEGSSLALVSFAGQPLDGTSLIIAYTLAGDTNLDAAVNLSDFTNFAANFGLAGTTGQGDFNFSGTVDLDDFTIFAISFGQILPSEAPRTAIPEPSLGFFVSAMTLMRRRRG